LVIEGLQTTRVRMIALVAFRRTTRGVVPPDLLVSFSNAFSP